MKKALYLMFGMGILGLMTFAWRMPVNAAALLQPTPFPTPTPGSDGRILYTVQEGDTLYRIAAVAGISLNELRQLNNRGADHDVLIPGQVILLGLAGPGPGLPTAAAGETPQGVTALTPTPTLIMDSGEVCVLLYADINGDAFRQETEMGILGGEVSVTAQYGGYSDKQPTKAGDPEVDALTCFENVPPGTYIVTMAIPDGWNETTVLTKTIDLLPGDTSYLNFGAQLSGLGRPQETGGGDSNGESGRSPMLGLLGILLLLGGAGLGVYSMYSNQQRRSRGGN
jgi:LysM repeat protein